MVTFWSWFIWTGKKDWVQGYGWVNINNWDLFYLFYKGLQSCTNKILTVLLVHSDSNYDQKAREKTTLASFFLFLENLLYIKVRNSSWNLKNKQTKKPHHCLGQSEKCWVLNYFWLSAEWQIFTNDWEKEKVTMVCVH